LRRGRRRHRNPRPRHPEPRTRTPHLPRPRMGRTPRPDRPPLSAPSSGAAPAPSIGTGAAPFLSALVLLWSSPSADLAQGLLDVLPQVLDVLDAHGHPDQPFADPRRAQL